MLCVLGIVSLLVLSSAYPSYSGSIIDLSLRRDANGRIIGGTDIEIEKAPYQVSLLRMGSSGYASHTCGGVIIGSNLILTAGHCVYSNMVPSNWKVRTGSTSVSSGGIIHDVSIISLHPEYTQTTFDYDIAIISVAGPISFDKKTSSINMADDETVINDNDVAFVTGWGLISEDGQTPDSLQSTNVSIVNQQRCEQAYSWLNDVTGRMICAGTMDLDDSDARDACSGDSGGPLTVNGVLVGLVSWGWGCALPTYPGVYTRISTLRDWIDSEADALTIVNL